jgi:hypothetical protein
MAWSDGISGLSPREFSDAVAENRAWGKRLREGTQALVRARLAKTITMEEYAAGRKRSNEEATECNRRRELLARCEAYRRPIIDTQVLG